MNARHQALRAAVALLAALALGTVAGSVIQTQFNLLALVRIGGEVTLAHWLVVTLQDIAGFGPLFAILLAVTLAASLPVAGLTARLLGGWRRTLMALAGGGGLLVAFITIDALAPMPTLIAATRSLPGTIAMLAPGAVAGWLFAHLTRAVHATEGRP